MHLNLFRRLLSGLRRLLARLRLPGGVYYIGGPEALPPPLTPEEEKLVFQGLEEGRQSCRDILITHNLRLVVYIARKFESSGVAVEDIISIGTIGLIKAVNTFVPAKNIKLATYASRCIENEILMFLRKSSNRRQETSIDEPLNTDGEGNELLLSDVLGTDQNQISAQLEQDAEKDMLLAAVDRLAPRERQIMQMRWPSGRRGAHPERGGRRDRHLPKLHLPAGKAHHRPAAPGPGKNVLMLQQNRAPAACKRRGPCSAFRQAALLSTISVCCTNSGIMPPRRPISLSGKASR